MLADTLVSVGVVVSGVVINLTGWTLVDPIIGLVIAVVILVSTWSLLSESLRMSTDAVPEGFDVDEIKKKIESQEDKNDTGERNSGIFLTETMEQDKHKTNIGHSNSGHVT